VGVVEALEALAVVVRRVRIVGAVASSFVAWRSKSARVPLCPFDALLGRFTPSMANISRPMRPSASQIATTAAKTRAMPAPSVLRKWAIVVKCGAVPPESAMNVTCSRQARSIPRLLMIPCAAATRTTLRSIVGGYAGAPVSSF